MMESTAALVLDPARSMGNQTRAIGEHQRREVGARKYSAIGVRVVWPKNVGGLKAGCNVGLRWLRCWLDERASSDGVRIRRELASRLVQVAARLALYTRPIQGPGTVWPEQGPGCAARAITASLPTEPGIGGVLRSMAQTHALWRMAHSWSIRRGQASSCWIVTERARNTAREEEANRSEPEIRSLSCRASK